MSKIFEGLKKNAIDLEGICEQGSELADALGEPPSSASDAPALTPDSGSERVAPLRVSAFSPIFPFSGEAHHAAAEQYRIIRTKILHHPKKPRLILISSASAGDGKTVTAVNVAASLSLKADAPVLLMDADLRRPRIAELLGLPSAPGLCNVLCGNGRLDDALLRAQEFPTLSILTAGEGARNAAEMLDSDQFRSVIDTLRKRFSHIILDAPPVAVVADYELLQNASDGVIMVIRPDHTDRNACVKALQCIPKEKFIGTVLNCMQESFFWKSPGYYYYAKQGGLSAK
jgi:capsular exopolysaccharide synthesis family protein